MKETILTRAANELLERQAEISMEEQALGAIINTGKRIWILQRYVKFCSGRGYLPQLGVFSMFGEYELLKISQGIACER